MAEAICKMITAKNEYDCSPSSAGLFINDIDGVAQNAVRVMDEIGVDISSHIPTQLTVTLTNEADIIVPMTKNHADSLLSVGVDEQKIKRLEKDIPDPYMQSEEVYRCCRDTLIEEIEKMLGSLFNDTETE